MSAYPTTVACELCAHRFDPNLRAGCSGCPLEPGCSIACCPACGYSSIDPEGSWTGRLVAFLARRRRRRLVAPVAGSTLADLLRGAQALIQDLDALPPGCRERLHAYGVMPGRVLEVVSSRAPP